MKISDWLNDDRKYLIAVSGVAAAYTIGDTVRTRTYFEHGWIHPLLIAGILAALFCIGLCLRSEWSRWVGSSALVSGVALVLWQTRLSGVSVPGLAVLVTAPFGLWYLWKLPITRVQALLNDPEFVEQLRRRSDEMMRELESQERWRIVILLREPARLDVIRLGQVAQQAFGRRFGVVARKIAPVDASFLPTERTEPLVAGATPVFVCYHPPDLLGVYAVASQHPEVSFDQSHASVREAITAHRACIEIEVLPYVGNLEPVRDGYTRSGPLAAALMDANCLAVFLPERSQLFAMSSALPDALRSPDPVSALESLRSRPTRES